MALTVISSAVRQSSEAGPGSSVESAADPVLVQPRFMARFSCLGSACPDTCCTGWVIDVEPALARRYRSHPDAAWRTRFARALVELRRRGGPPRTVVRFDERGCCPLLRADGLCSVQAELGEDWLPWVCRTFPRLEHGTGSLRYRTGSLGCVEVARKVLFDADALVESCDGDPRAIVARPAAAARSAKGPMLSDDEAAWLRASMLRLIGRHDLPWSARVTLFCVTLEDLGRLDLVRDRSSLLDLVLRTEALLERPELAEFDARPPAFSARATALLVPILRVFVEIGRGGSTLAATARALTEPLRTESGGAEAPNAASVSRLAEAASAVLGPALRTRPHLPGNLLGAALLQERFPMGRPSAAVEAAWNAAFFVALWKILTVAAMEARGQDFETAGVEVAYRLGRVLAHWPAATRAVRRDIERRGSMSMAVLAALLR